MRNKFLFCVIFILFSLISACTSIGPHKVNKDRGRYNDVVQETDSEQILKNIVRLHYLEPVLFLKVSNVNVTYSNSLTIRPAFDYTDFTATGAIKQLTRHYALETPYNYTEQPSVLLTPITNAEFITALLSPVKLQDLFLLFYSGTRNLGRISKLAIQTVNEIENVLMASPETPIAPRFCEFFEIIKLLDQMAEERAFILSPEKTNGDFYIRMDFNENRLNSPTVREFKTKLKIPASKKTVIIGHGHRKTESIDLSMTTRSILGMMSLLSHGVRTPPCDRKYTMPTFYTNGKPFDWNCILHDMIAIYYSDSEAPPCDAYVVTRYRGHWFYIKDSDTNSKATFLLLSEIFALTAGQQPTTISPILTPPIVPAR